MADGDHTPPVTTGAGDPSTSSQPTGTRSGTPYHANDAPNSRKGKSKANDAGDEPIDEEEEYDDEQENGEPLTTDQRIDSLRALL